MAYHCVSLQGTPNPRNAGAGEHRAAGDTPLRGAGRQPARAYCAFGWYFLLTL